MTNCKHNFILQAEPSVVQSEIIDNEEGEREWKDFVILHCSCCGKVYKQYVNDIEILK